MCRPAGAAAYAEPVPQWLPGRTHGCAGSGPAAAAGVGSLCAHAGLRCACLSCCLLAHLFVHLLTPSDCPAHACTWTGLGRGHDASQCMPRGIETSHCLWPTPHEGNIVSSWHCKVLPTARVCLRMDGRRSALTAQSARCAGAQVDNAQMLPSPFDNVHGGASAVTHVPSSMQQSAPPEDAKAAGEPGLPHVSHMGCFQQGPHALQHCLTHAQLMLEAPCLALRQALCQKGGPVGWGTGSVTWPIRHAWTHARA